MRRRSLPLLAALVLAMGSTGAAAAKGGGGTTSITFTYSRATSPARTLVYDAAGAWVATFTDNARMVILKGASRTFREPTYTSATVTHATWIRLLSSPFTGSVNATWLKARLADASPDLLAIAFQYVVGTPALVDGTGLQYAGDASYGPLQADGTRAEGSDFNDYLGIAWSYPGGTTDTPETAQFRALDCSGFMRMVLGYRSGLPLTLLPDGGSSLPRRAVQMDQASPGIVLISNAGTAPTDRSILQPGDLVFFDASTNDGTAIDHVGMYLGRDNGGHDRFISSRKSADGPTMGDLNGKSLLDGAGLYATSFRSARRP